jgi:hypothetical protein
MRDDDIREGGREDEVGASAKRDRREDWHDPVHTAIRREREPKKRYGHQHATNLAHPESELRRRLVLAVGVFVFVVPPWGWALSEFFFFIDDGWHERVRTGSSRVGCTTRGSSLSPFRGTSGLCTAC